MTEKPNARYLGKVKLMKDQASGLRKLIATQSVDDRIARALSILDAIQPEEIPSHQVLAKVATARRALWQARMGM